MLNAYVSIHIYIYIYIKDPCLYSNSSKKHQCLAKLKLTLGKYSTSSAYSLNCHVFIALPI